MTDDVAVVTGWVPVMILTGTAVLAGEIATDR